MQLKGKRSWAPWVAVLVVTCLCLYTTVHMHEKLRVMRTESLEIPKVPRLWFHDGGDSASLLQVTQDSPNSPASSGSLLEAPVQLLDNSNTKRLEAGIDIHQAPRLDLFMEQILAALRPYQANFLTKHLGADASTLCQGSTCQERATAPKVWNAFQKAVLAGLQDPVLRLNASFGPPRDDDSIFLSIASYRDPQCRDTVRHAFERAERPEKIAVGIVQQNCVKNCTTGTGWGKTRRIFPTIPDVDCIQEFCASDLGRPHCAAGRVRILRVTELEALGPFFARFLNSKLWRGETYYMQIDSHIGFRSGWDNTLVEMIKKTPSYPHSVISNYPQIGNASSNESWPKFKGGEITPNGLCDVTFFKEGQAQTLRLEHTFRQFKQDQHGIATPRHTCFVAAGFYFTHGSIVDKVPFDPLLPFIFMGEEIALSHRFWTSGYDIYGPSADVLSHEYLRYDHQKFWETVDAVFSNSGIFKQLEQLILPRIRHLVGFPEAQNPDKIEPKSVLALMQDYSGCSARTSSAFAQVCGLDYGRGTQTKPHWCSNGTKPPQDLFAWTSSPQ